MSIRSSQEVQRAIDEQTSRIAARLTAIRQDFTDVGSPVRSAISRHPARALAIALGSGVALGVLLSQSLLSRECEKEPAESPAPYVAPPRRSVARKSVQMLLPILVDFGLKYLTRNRS